MGWERSGGDEVVGCVFGGVSARVVCERLGVPILERGDGYDGDGQELWNGVDIGKRLVKYWERLVSKGVFKSDFEEYAWK